MIIAKSLTRKVFATAVAAAGFVSLYEVTMLDSQHTPWGPDRVADARPPEPGTRLPFAVTAYCKGLVTAAGVAAQSGVAASDPTLLPLGSVVEVDFDDPRYDGIYSILDTGPAVQGREIDLYMWSCHDALDFGRRSARVTVLRLGWNPKAITPSFMQRFFWFSDPPPGPAPLPSRPLPIVPPEGN